MRPYLHAVAWLHLPKSLKDPRYARTLWLLLVAWIGLCVLLCVYVVYEQDQVKRDLCKREARIAIDKDLAYRGWVSEMGGVFVTIGKVQPNPYLAGLVVRDVQTKEGLDLTLVNPAYMTRLVHEREAKLYGRQAHLTSLNPIRPENAPDKWERQALLKCEKSDGDVVEVCEEEGGPVLRYMAPFRVVQSCLKCHGQQGYKEGDLRGGLSVSIPIGSAWYTTGGGRVSSALVVIGCGWMFVSLGLVIVMTRQVRIQQGHDTERNELLARLRSSLEISRKQEQRWRSIVTNTQAAYFLYDANLCLVDVNEAWLRMHGYATKEEVLGRKVSSFLTQEGLEKAKPWMTMLFQGQGITIDQNTHLRKDGSQGEHAVSAVAFMKDGRFDGTEGFLIDLSSLHRERDANEQILNEMIEGFVLLELHREEDGHVSSYQIKKANKAFMEYAGMAGSVLSEKSGYELFPKQADSLVRTLAEIAFVGEPRSFDADFLGDGRVCVVHAFSPRKGICACTLFDITESIQVRMHLERDEAELLALYDEAPVMLALVDGRRRLRRVNRTMLNFAHKDEQAAVGNMVGPLFNCIHNLDTPKGCGHSPSCQACPIREAIRNALDHGQSTTRREVTMSIQGKVSPEEYVFMFSVARLHLGPEPFALLCMEDVSETRRMQSQFLRMQRIENLGNLSAGVAHDLNNILVPIMMSVDLLSPVAEKAQLGDIMTLLKSSAQRGADIVRQLLIFGRGTEMHRTNANPADLVGELAHLVKETFPKEITFEEKISREAWCIHADSTQVHQVLLNLCINARDAMPRGGHLSIEVCNVCVRQEDANASLDARPGNYVVFAIRDTGTGIPESIIDKIFDPFFTTKALGKGTGLGLSTVMGIVRSHGGFLRVESVMGRGTCFRVYLPAGEVGVVDSGAGDELAAYAGNGQTVLLIDDEEGVRVILRLGLVNYGYKVMEASDGASGLALFTENQERIDAVLCDIMMPNMNGRMTIDCMRQIKPGVAVVAISGMSEKVLEVDGLKREAVPFVQKPFELVDVLRALRTALRRGES